MDATPNGEPLTIDFAGQVLFLSESAPGIVRIEPLRSTWPSTT